MKIGNEKGLGYVESLIAIAISGILLVAVAVLATSIIRSTLRNELQDNASQQTVMYLDIIRAIKDNGWSTADGSFPDFGTGVYEICYSAEGNKYYLCDASESGAELFTIGDDTFDRSITIAKTDTLVTFTVNLVCKPAKCVNIRNTQKITLSLSNDNLSSSAGDDPGVDLLCGDGDVDPGEECDPLALLPGQVCSSSCTLLQPCGNGTLEGTEACDDGNSLDGDWCSSTCISTCASGWVQNGTSCYKYATNASGVPITSGSWNNSFPVCASLGAHFPIITSSAENTFIASTFSPVNSTTNPYCRAIFIGLKKLSNFIYGQWGSGWYWTNGSALSGTSYKNWRVSPSFTNPDNATGVYSQSGGETCAMMIGSRGRVSCSNTENNMKWDDVYCPEVIQVTQNGPNYNNFVVCEREL